MPQLKLNNIKPEALSELRSAYHAGLPAAQEYYLETLVAESQWYSVSREGQISGYLALIGRTLTEFYLAPDFSSSALADFDEIREQIAIEAALCKAFDRPLLAICRQRARTFDTVAWLYREWLPGHNEPTDLLSRQAESSDRELILAHHDDFFSEAEITRLIAVQGLWLYFSQRELRACGLIQKILADSPSRDIGMVVSPKSRGSGLGLRVVRHLAGLCLAQNLVPVCGCAADNQASRRTLDKAGFAARYALLRASF